MVVNIIGIIVIIAMLYLLAKRYESRMVLFVTGVILCAVAGDIMASFYSFSDAIKNAKVIEPIVASMGFAFVLKYTQCDKHLVFLLAKGLKKAGVFLVPGAVLVTAFINISITSSVGCSAAVGAIIIPLLMRMGVSPAIAASTVFLGTYGSANLNPGYAQTIIVADVASSARQALENPLEAITSVDVIAYSSIYFTISAILCAVILMLVAIKTKEYKGYKVDDDLQEENFKVNFIKSIVPIIPIVLLIVSNARWIEALPKLAISHAMIISSIVALIVTYKTSKPSELVKKFFAGMGEGFSHVYGIILCALIFVSGLKAIGFIEHMINAMKENPQIANIAGTVGAFILAFITGSGDAAALSFNQAVTIHSYSFGIDPMHLGATITAVAGLGRSMSPIAGAAIVCAGYAKISPLELSKRNALPVIITSIVITFLMLY